MSIRNLDKMFRPQSVAVIGASTRPQSVGGTVVAILLAWGLAVPGRWSAACAARTARS